MKRKEMVQHIYEELLDKLNHYKFKQGPDVWAEFVANELLDMIEGFGMLPPKAKHKTWLTELTTIINMRNEWEPEEEE